jgi:hypothetical protein
MKCSVEDAAKADATDGKEIKSKGADRKLFAPFLTNGLQKIELTLIIAKQLADRICIV